MTAILSIDPGVHKMACAWFQDGALRQVALEPPDRFLEPGWAVVSELVIEKPQLYKGADEKDPNDCVDVFGAACFVEGLLVSQGGPRAKYVLPREWKGQLDKPPHHMRVWAALKPFEREAFAHFARPWIQLTKVEQTWPLVEFIGHKIGHACEMLARNGKVTGYSWQAHNLLDAVGLGLWHLKRTGRGGRRF